MQDGNGNHDGKSLQVNLHFDTTQGQPVLIGVSVECYGWILGGERTGNIKVSGKIRLNEKALQIGSKAELKQLRRDFKNFTYAGNGSDNLPVGPLEED